MRMRIVIEYDPVERLVAVVENDFRAIELLGLLEYVKSIVMHAENEGELN